MADKRISQLIERTDILNNDVLPIVASGATTTNKVTISTIQDWMQENLDVGVTSVGITLGSSGTDVNVSGSPITTSGNITINIPTASASNRGLLSSADWSTFNGKQNSITLTTSGTSGAATLVGSTLNIPNYSTGVANAYVPYVGAIGSVTLGYNSLSASQINIDGASPTGGSYLGFKHSNSVNTGTDGYTSMYTFGTNTIAFKSITGANSKDFSFSMVGITPNVPGGRVYTLPDASGTLALTSDLGGYVTLDTAQTITGSKTFNSRIIGQDATLTGSGSADTLEVTHSSGSGIAVDISKGGNGEGLRVAKTSGSGNAVTITGGLLSAEAATLSGALNGTSASFTGAAASSTIPTLALNQGASPYGQISGAGDASHGLIMRGVPASGSTSNFSVTAGDVMSFYEFGGAFKFFKKDGTLTEQFSISSTGDATFSSSVTAGGVTVSSGNTLQLSGGTGNNWQLYKDGSNGLQFYLSGGGPAMYINSSQNVGIGTSTPSQKLDVIGKIRATDDLILAQTNPVIAYDNGSTGALRFASNGGNTERMRITSGGNVGIGNTTSSWSTGTSLEIGSTGNLALHNSSAIGNLIAFNTYYNGAWYYKQTSVALGYIQDSDGHKFYNNGIGTANTTFTPTERMRITSGGYLKASNTGGYWASGGDYHEHGQSSSGNWNTIMFSSSTNPFGVYMPYTGGSPNNTGNQYLYCTDSSALRFEVRSNGGIGNFQANNVNLSDERTKKDIEPLESYWDKFKEIEIVKFKYKDQTHDDFNIGVIAQQVESVAPEFVDVDGWDTRPKLDEEGNEIVSEEEPLKSIYTADLYHASIKVLQEAMAKIEKLEAEVEALKSQING